jgi:hypothetical protein
MSFAARFKTQALALTEAAKKFQSFDEMAAEDEYIHSDSLNVKKQSTSTTDTATKARTSDVLNSIILEKQPPSRRTSDTLNSLITLDESAEPHRRPSSDSGRLSPTSRSNDSSVHGREDDGNNSVRSEKEDRPLKKKTSDLVSSSQESRPARKSANRFMDDLDSRLSKPIIDVDVESGLPHQPVETSKSDNDNRWGWIKDAAKSRVHEFMGQTTAADEERVPFRSPLSRTASKVEPAKKEVEFHVGVVDSTSVLQAEEQAELDRLRLGAQGDPLTLMLNVVKQHPQFAFIAFTLVLGSAVYFYSRHRTEDDVA